MKTSEHEPALGALQSSLDEKSVARLKSVAATNDLLARWRQEHLEKAFEEMTNIPDVVQHLESTEKLIQSMQNWRQLELAGSLGAEKYWRNEMEPLWARLFKGKGGQFVRDLYKRYDLGRNGFEQNFYAALRALEGNRTHFRASFDEFGLDGLEEDTKSQNAATDPDTQEVGTVQQPLNPTVHRCLTTPYQFAVASKADTGPTINTSSAGGAVESGSGFASAMTQAYIAMGGGSSASSFVGVRVEVPPGATRFGCSAIADVSFAGISIGALAGATASIDLVLRVNVGIGANFSQRCLLSAIPSPVIWGRSVNRVVRDLEVGVDDVGISSTPGPYTMVAGVEVYAAAVGIVGSAAARMSANFVIKKMCVTFD